MPQINLRQLELTRFDLRLDLLDEMEVGLFRRGVFRMAGHGDIAQGAFLIQRGAQFAAIQEPPLQLVRRFAARRALFQRIEQRGDLREVPQVNLLRDKHARAVRSQLVKRQQVHFSKEWNFMGCHGQVQPIQIGLPFRAIKKDTFLALIDLD